MMDESDKSSDISDVDPQALIDSLKNIDDLDADLFSGSKVKSEKKPEKTVQSVKSSLKQPNIERKKKVSFHDKTELDKDDFGFDPDDPLGDLLHDDDLIFDDKELNTPVEKSFLKSSKQASTVEKPQKEDKLFDDNDDDILDALGLDDEKPEPREKASSRSALDLLGFRNEPDILKANNKPRNLRFDKDGNFIKDVAPIKQAPSPAMASTDSSFGVYTPSTSTGRNRRSVESKKPEMDSSSFLDFLNSDIEAHSNSASKKEATSGRSKSLSTNPTSTSGVSTRPKSAEFLGLGQEIDLGEVELPLKRPSSSSIIETKKSSLTALPPQSIAKEIQIPSSPNSSAITSNNSNPDHSNNNYPNAFGTKPDLNPTVAPLNDPNEPVKPIATRVSRRSHDGELFSPTLQSLPSKPKIPQTESKPWVPDINQALQMPATNRPQSMELEIRVQNLENQLEHARGLLHQVQLGHQADLDLAKQAYDGRVEILQHSLTDIRSRAERESRSVRESYAARLDAVRQQVREHAVEAASQDIVEQEEIKRLRALHLQALEETRRDHEDQVSRIKRCHLNEIEALKTSTVYVRNMDSMMEKVNDSTQQLQKLTAKYETAFHFMTQQSDNIAVSNKDLSSALQKQLQQIQQQNEEAQKNLQHTVSRLEGTISEMNHRFEEQQYRMQAEQSRLQSAQTSLELEKKHLLQLVQSEREQARKAQNEAIDLQRNLQREAKEDRDRLVRREEDVRLAFRSAEEKREEEAALRSQREREARSASEALSRDRSSLAERSERIAALEAKLHMQKEEYERRMSDLKSTERNFEERSETLINREKLLKDNEEKHAQRIKESTHALQEAKRVEREHELRMNELHTQSDEVTSQRQLLAEERKILVEGRLESQRCNVSAKSNPQASPAVLYDLTPTKLHRSDLGISASSYTTHVDVVTNPETVLWNHTAEQDQNYLEDEKFFLEALKHTPYSATKS